MATTVTIVQMSVNGTLVECSSNGRSWEIVGVIKPLAPGFRKTVERILHSLLTAVNHDGPRADERIKSNRSEFSATPAFPEVD